MEYDGQNFLSFCTIFCPFIRLKTWKITILIKFKKLPGDIIILHKCTKNHDYMLYCSWDTMRDGCNSYYLFWAINCFFNNPKSQNLKKEKKLLEISSFYTCIPKIMITWCMVFLKYGAQWMSGQTDGRKKLYVEVGDPTKN